MPKDDALERLSKKLDNTDPEHVRRSSIPVRAGSAPAVWQETAAPGKQPDVAEPMAKKKYGRFEKIFLGSAIFFVASFALAGVLIFFGNNIVSTKNVDVQISGPESIAGGDTVTLQVVVTNRNSVSIQLADLVVQFPPGTRSDQDIALPIPSTRTPLGTIAPGESVNRTVKAVLFGASGAELPIKASVEYRVQSSNAVFVSENTYTARITQSPAAITTSAEKEAVSGQSVPITVTVTSNSPQVLKDMLLIANYPPGFTFQNADPAASLGNSAWMLGDIEPGGSRTIHLSGVFTGEDGDTKTITFTTGSRKSNTDTVIAAALAVAQSDITVTKPFVSASIVLNGSVADQHTVKRGAPIEGQVQWANNLPVSIQNLSIEMRLNGEVIDPESVRVESGFYSSSNSDILWDQTTNPDFANVPPGSSGALGFTLRTYPPESGQFKNPVMTFTVSVQANRSSEGNVAEAVSGTAATKAVVASDLVLSSGLAYVSGPSTPKANTETVYAVTWNVANSANSLGNTAVTATIPSYVRFIGGNGVTFDKTQSRVSWNVGDLSANDARNVTFQIGVTPSISQLGTAPVLLSSQKATAFDRFVQDSVEGHAPDLSTGSAGGEQSGLVTK
ncbi:MAG: hypothetical protein JO026_03095 [Patescibacteria group bacterium]|nr:hypothetical protein [Patescibacteria group bacterium]